MREEGGVGLCCEEDEGGCCVEVLDWVFILRGEGAGLRCCGFGGGGRWRAVMLRGVG